MIGRKVKVTVDRPLGSRHPEYTDMVYPVNYGYIAGIIAPDGEEQDAYILGVDHPEDVSVLFFAVRTLTSSVWITPLIRSQER